MENALFSRDKVNTGRQFNLDLAKFLAIFFMVFVHVYMLFGDFYTPEHSVEGFKIIGIYLGGVFAAPLFMFSMGVGIIYSRNSAPGLMAKRSGDLYFKGLLLNVFRFTIPYTIVYFMKGYFKDTVFSSIFNLDILQFAALAFLLTALLLKLKLKPWHILLLAIGLNLVQTFLKPIPEINEYADFVIGHFLNTETQGSEVSTNPFLSWYIFVAAGLVFGDLLIRCKNTKKFYLILLVSSFILTTIYFVLAEIILQGPCTSKEGVNLFHQMRIYDGIGIIFADIFFISVCYFVQNAFKGKVKTLVSQGSSLINSIYCIHWVILIFLSIFVMRPILGDGTISEWIVLLISLGLFVVSYLIAVFYKKFIKYLKNKKTLQNQ